MIKTDRQDHESLMQKEGTATTRMGGKTCKGFLNLHYDVVKEHLQEWMQIAADYNLKVSTCSRGNIKSAPLYQAAPVDQPPILHHFAGTLSAPQTAVSIAQRRR